MGIYSKMVEYKQNTVLCEVFMANTVK